MKNTEQGIKYRMHRLMIMKGMNQQTFARKLSVSPATMSRLLDNSKPDKLPSLDLINKICEEYQVSSDWLLGRLPEESTGMNQQPVLHYGDDIYNQRLLKLLESEPKVLWMQFSTGKAFSWFARPGKILKKILFSDDFEELRILIGEPNSKGTLDQIRFRRGITDNRQQAVEDSINESVATLKKLACELGVNSKVTIAYTRYVPMVMYIADPYDTGGQMIALERNFHEAFDQAPLISLMNSINGHQKLFEYYRQEFERLFRSTEETVPTDKAYSAVVRKEEVDCNNHK